MIKMKEIGSEFEEYEFNSIPKEKKTVYEYIGETFNKDYKFVMSGRTAIYYVLNNINVEKKVVYMPDFCCESMVKVFLDSGYKIEYYNADVINNKYYIDTDMECGIFFAMSYFGYSESNMDYYIEKFSSRNIIVIEDITHRLLCRKAYCENSTYLIASLRKWFPILSGGIAVSLKDKFIVDIDNYTINQKLISKKNEAMHLKKIYLEEGRGEKESFLSLFHECEGMFECYKNKAIDEKSLEILKKIDFNDIIYRRRRNALAIEQRIMNLNTVRLLYNLSNDDCPLFVPVCVKERDGIRKKLIHESIFCPVHWPNFNKFKNIIYDDELSLICDQRYSEEDIKKYINKLNVIVGE